MTTRYPDIIFGRYIYFLLVLVLGISGCAGTPVAIIGIDNPKTPALSVKGAKNHDIFIMTSRAPDPNPSIFYSGERSESLGLAKVTVTIPPDHVSGNIERPSRSPPDPRKEFTIVNPERYASAPAFANDVEAALRSRPPEDRTILGFVHGYNTTLTEGILRLAQFVEDSGYKGVPVLFSWASRGKVLDYVYDLNSALQARDDLIRGSRILAGTGANGFDIVAHSMGNFLTVEAMRQAKLEGRYNDNRIRTIILASPDIDVDVFKEELKPFAKNERRFYVLISANDKALAISKRIAGGINRVGAEDAAELAKLGVTVIDLTKVADKADLNHSKFADSPEIVRLIGKRLESGGSLDTAASNPKSLRSLTSGLLALPATVLTGGGRIIVFQ